MFGYIIPDKPYLYMKDYGLYRSLYCGICVATGKKYGLIARATTNYDMTFLSALFHNYLSQDVVLKKTNCILHPFGKRMIATPDNVTNLLCASNIMLCYYNLTDDVLDEGGFKKRFARGRIKKAYKKVKKEYPTLEIIVKENYDNLRALEQNKNDSLDMLSDCFGKMMQNVAMFVAGDKTCADLETMAYNFGKWVYLIDAVDDLEKDYKKKQFNPYISAFKNYESRDKFIEDNQNDIEFSLYSAIQEIEQSYSKLDLPYNKELTDNIVYRGLKERTKGILSGCMAGKTPKI